MTAPRKIELKTAGQSALLQVHSCGLAKAGKYPEVEFVGLDEMNRSAMIAVNQKSADRQLVRIDLTYASAPGHILKFSRSASDDPAKPYWNIDNAGEIDLPDETADPHAEIPHPADVENGKTETAQQTAKDIYLAITKHTLAHVVPLYVEAKIPIDMQAVAAIVATRFIAATRNGHG